MRTDTPWTNHVPVGNARSGYYRPRLPNRITNAQFSCSTLPIDGSQIISSLAVSHPLSQVLVSMGIIMPTIATHTHLSLSRPQSRLKRSRFVIHGPSIISNRSRFHQQSTARQLNSDHQAQFQWSGLFCSCRGKSRPIIRIISLVSAPLPNVDARAES